MVKFDYFSRLMVMVTIERCTAVRFPLHSHIFWRRSRTLLMIGAVFLVAFGLNAFQYVARKVTLAAVGRQDMFNSTINCTYTWDYVNPRLEPIKFAYVKVSFHVVFILSIVMPLLLLASLNSVLLHYLRKSGEQISDKELNDARKDSRLVQERKVTLTVATIILTFVVFNLPGGIVQAYELVSSQFLNSMNLLFYDIAELCNCLTISQKTANFFLYCFSSSAFRRRLFLVLFGTKKLRLSRRRAARFPRQSSAGSIKPSQMEVRCLSQCRPPATLTQLQEDSDGEDNETTVDQNTIGTTEKMTFL